MDLPLVSIITVNYDNAELTCQLLRSLGQMTYSNTEIIVVDNDSPHDDPSVITEKFPGVILVRNRKNAGFAGGNNLGIRHAKGKYLLFLNNDTEVEAGFLEPLVDKLGSNPAIGAVSPQIRYFYEPDTLQFAGYAPINPYTVRGKSFGFRSKDLQQFDHDAPTAYLHGAAMLVRREVLQNIGLMAECYFLYYEEIDWASRMNRHGYQLWYVHDSVIFHKESSTIGKLNPSRIYYLNRARVLYLRRNIRGFQFFLAVLYLIMVSVPVNSLKFMLKGQYDYLKAYGKAMAWHVSHLSAKELFLNPEL